MEEKDEILNGEPEEPKYEDLKTDEAEREIDLGDEEMPQTLSEAEEETKSRTDIQAILRELIPKLPSERMRKLLQPALVSRVFPDNFTDKHFLLAASIIEEDGDEADVIGTISIVQDILSKAYEGRHIIDLLELAGVAHEEEMEKLSRELGI